jgi:hypothetical protein
MKVLEYWKSGRLSELLESLRGYFSTFQSFFFSSFHYRACFRFRGLGVFPVPECAAIVLIVLTVACAETTAPRDMVLARQQLDAYLAQCTARYGYDPDAASALGPYTLGAGEREWRECVYEGVEKFMIPKTLSPEVYRKAIAEDRQMTAAVAGGKMTRSERRERMQKLIEEIQRIEEANRAKLQGQQDMMLLMRRTLSPLTRP